MRLFLDAEHAAAGSPGTGFPLGAAPKASALCDATPSVRSDLDPTHGLGEADNSPREQGTLLLPPALAIAFRPLPSERTLLTVCALRSAVGFCTVAHRGNHPDSVLTMVMLVLLCAVHATTAHLGHARVRRILRLSCFRSRCMRARSHAVHASFTRLHVCTSLQFCYCFLQVQVPKKKTENEPALLALLSLSWYKRCDSRTWTYATAMCVQQATPVLPPMLASLTCAFGARQQTQWQRCGGRTSYLFAATMPPSFRPRLSPSVTATPRRRPPRQRRRAPAAVRRRAVPVTHRRSSPHACIVVPVSVTGPSARRGGLA